MNSTNKTTQKTSGIHKIKLGQLVTLNGHVYQCIKYRLNCCRETELQMEHKTQVQVRSSPIQVNNVLNYQNYEHFREIAG